MPPARTLGVLIRDCPITVYSDGLMSYGPARDDVAAEIDGRALPRAAISTSLRGSRPLLLRGSTDAQQVAIPDTEFLAR